ncbi:hypothetical protein DL769_005117 [Monosporascus sp. CRB-8-3]|nr:hypothetical protein DL769_005117 [Monosporascus sp. CRB-8-3]
MGEQQFQKEYPSENGPPGSSTAEHPDAGLRVRIRPVASNKLGRLINLVFRDSTLFFIYVGGFLLPIWRDEITTEEPWNQLSDLFLSPSHLIPMCSAFAFTITFALGIPRSKLYLPPLLYAAVVLHQEQRKSGRTERKVILLAKVLVFLASGVTLILCLGLPTQHRAKLPEDLKFLHRPDLPWTMAIAAYVIVCYEILAITWAVLATPLLAWAVVMDLLLCFAWSPEPEMFTLEELREMAAMEEAQKDKPRESQGPATTSLIWRLQRGAAALGVDMAWFAYRQFEMRRQ